MKLISRQSAGAVVAIGRIAQRKLAEKACRAPGDLQKLRCFIKDMVKKIRYKAQIFSDTLVLEDNSV